MAADCRQRKAVAIRVWGREGKKGRGETLCFSVHTHSELILRGGWEGNGVPGTCTRLQYSGSWNRAEMEVRKPPFTAWDPGKGQFPALCGTVFPRLTVP